MPEKYSGADWIAQNFKVELSPLGAKVADVLGQTFQGIYHLDVKALKRVDWKNNLFIEVSINKSKGGILSSYDNCTLTLLLLLCFDNMLRVNISPRTFHLLTLQFHQREKRDGGMSERLPELDDLIKNLRANYSLPKEMPKYTN